MTHDGIGRTDRGAMFARYPCGCIAHVGTARYEPTCRHGNALDVPARRDVLAMEGQSV